MTIIEGEAGRVEVSQELMQTMLEHSVKDYHVKGLNYLCLERSPDMTVKVYFFDDSLVCDRLPDVVSPHDHRYRFDTYVLQGEMSNSVYEPHPHGQPYFKHLWFTPFLGGSGFMPGGPAKLIEESRQTYRAGDVYRSKARDIHTIRIHEPGTVIMLHQLWDEVDAGTPTSTYTQQPEPPSIDGLYNKFTEGEIHVLYARFKAIRQ